MQDHNLLIEKHHVSSDTSNFTKEPIYCILVQPKKKSLRYDMLVMHRELQVTRSPGTSKLYDWQKITTRWTTQLRIAAHDAELLPPIEIRESYSNMKVLDQN